MPTRGERLHGRTMRQTRDEPFTPNGPLLRTWSPARRPKRRLPRSPPCSCCVSEDSTAAVKPSSRRARRVPCSRAQEPRDRWSMPMPSCRCFGHRPPTHVGIQVRAQFGARGRLPAVGDEHGQRFARPHTPTPAPIWTACSRPQPCPGGTRPPPVVQSRLGAWVPDPGRGVCGARGSGRSRGVT